MSGSEVGLFLLRYDTWWIVCLVISPNLAIFPESMRMRMPVIIIEASPTHTRNLKSAKDAFPSKRRADKCLPVLELRKLRF